MSENIVATYREGGGSFPTASDATDISARERGVLASLAIGNGKIDEIGEAPPGPDLKLVEPPIKAAGDPLSSEPAPATAIDNSAGIPEVPPAIAAIPATPAIAPKSTKKAKRERIPEASLPEVGTGVENGPLLSPGTFDAVLPPEAESHTWSNWLALQSHINEWYHDLDFEAFRIALATIVSHKFLQEEPVWTFLIGPAGTGKTVTIHALSDLPNTHVLGDLTPQTFLSGFNKGKKYSLLHQVGNSATFLFKDLTTFLSKRVEERAIIGSHLREIYDGSFNKSTGASQKLHWEGKITVLAATTPALERAWTVLRDMGERFVTVRWPRGDGIMQAEKAHKQIGHEKEIIDGLKKLTMAFLDIEHMKPAEVPSILAGQFRSIIYMAEMVAKLRAHVGREGDGKREINDIPSPEGATRLMKVMTQIVKAHATMFRRAKATQEDLKVARRVAIDSVPYLRWRLISILPEDGELSLADVREMSGMPRCAIDWNMDELTALGIVQQGEETGKWYALTESFKKLKGLALG